MGVIFFLTNGSLILSEEEKPFYYLNIGFLRSKSYAENLVFNDLTLGVEVWAEGHFRIFLGEKIVSTGLLQRGLNMIDLFDPRLKENPGTHIYKLEIKRRGILFVKEVELSLSWPKRHQPQKKKVVFEKTESLEYDLSMYLGDKKVAGGKKRINWQVREQRPMVIGRGPPSGRMDLRDGSFPNLKAINWLQVFSYLKKRSQQKKFDRAMKGKLLVHQTSLTFAQKISAEKKRIIKGSMSIRIIKNYVVQ